MAKKSLKDELKAKRAENSESDCNIIDIDENETLNRKSLGDLIEENPPSENNKVVKWSSGQVTGQVTGQLPSQVDNWSSGQVTSQVDNWSSGQVVNWSSGHELTKRQVAVLNFIYHNRPFKVAGENGLGIILGIGPRNIRNQLKSLVNKGYIHKPYGINNGVFVGSTCRIIEEKCKPLLGDTHIINPPAEKKNSGQVDNWSSGQVVNWSSGQVVKSYNSSSSNILTTTNAISSAIASDREIGWWFHCHDLDSDKITSWVYEFNLDTEIVLKIMRYVRWKIQNGHIKINTTPVDYLYGAIKRSKGKMEKPTGYKSMAEIDREIIANFDAQKVERDRKEASELDIRIKPTLDDLLSNLDLKNPIIKAGLLNIHPPTKRQEIENAIKNKQKINDKHMQSLKFGLRMAIESQIKSGGVL